MSTFDPLISPWLAVGSCIGFTVMFVGSLYIFPIGAICGSGAGSTNRSSDNPRYGHQGHSTSSRSQGHGRYHPLDTAAPTTRLGGGGQISSPASPRPSGSSARSSMGLRPIIMMHASRFFTHSNNSNGNLCNDDNGPSGVGLSNGTIDTSRNNNASSPVLPTSLTFAGQKLNEHGVSGSNSSSGSGSNSSSGSGSSSPNSSNGGSSLTSSNQIHRQSVHLHIDDNNIASSTGSSASPPLPLAGSTSLAASTLSAMSFPTTSFSMPLADHNSTIVPLAISSSSPLLSSSCGSLPSPIEASAPSPSPSIAGTAKPPVKSTRPEVAILSHEVHNSYDRYARHGHPGQDRSHTNHSSNNDSWSHLDLAKLDRDHPLVIIHRSKGILLTLILVPIYLWWIFGLEGIFPSDQSFWPRVGVFLELLGVSVPGGKLLKILNHVAVPLFLVAVLFLGPLMMMFMSNELPFQRGNDWSSPRQQRYPRGWRGLRDFVIGPISEEMIFRACMVAITAQSGAKVSTMVFTLPLVFGIAHIHHGYETYVKKGRTRLALKNALVMSGFQFLYTTLFGWFATFLFLRTSNLLGPCLCHSFCNMMGFPDVTNIQYYGRMKYWLYLAFGLGVILFSILLIPLTNPNLYGDQDTLVYWRLFFEMRKEA
ncbi:CAAX prenyl protease [Lunasporangiospora selenospora]|uniref:intramembrane prenyl-peptidase Rce1 n=1 Tax=Lunasporangiospora selenospora TaxID=979761 RepID=A0A9P6FP97_9FUNG|nr:CAAX prenyl protease [Lunasporangiospora selenospora]